MAGRRAQFVLSPLIDQRLDQLLNAVRAEGNPFSRSDIVSALIWQAPDDGDALGVMIRQYRREGAKAAPTQPPRRGPGPRPLIDQVEP